LKRLRLLYHGGNILEKDAFDREVRHVSNQFCQVHTPSILIIWSRLRLTLNREILAEKAQKGKHL
jgi:hypothetical protein